MKIVHTNEAPAAIGPYSQGIIVNNLFYSSGQIPLTAEGNLYKVILKYKRIKYLKILQAVLKEAGASFRIGC